MEIKQIKELLDSKVKLDRSKYFYMSMDDTKEEVKFVIDIPEYTEVNVLGMYFDRDIVSKIIFRKWISESDLIYFSFYIYSGNLNLGHCFIDSSDILISCGKYPSSSIEIKACNEISFYKRHYGAEKIVIDDGEIK